MFAWLYAAAYIDGVAPRLNLKESGRQSPEFDMKSKVFNGEGPAIIKAVNGWLAADTGISIRHTETRDAPADPVTGASRMRFEVWYDQEGK